MTLESFQISSRPFKFDKLTPCWLDRLADIELQQGHTARAEHLAHRATELREVSQ
jgi:hypothetical protein